MTSKSGDSDRLRCSVFTHAWATSKTLKYILLGFYLTVCMQNRWQCFFWGGLRRRQFVPTTADHFPRRRVAWTTEKYVASVSMLKLTDKSTVWKLCHLKTFVCFPMPCLFHTYRDWFWGCLRKRAMFNCQRQLHVSTKLCLANCLNCSKCKSPLCLCMLSRCLMALIIELVDSWYCSCSCIMQSVNTNQSNGWVTELQVFNCLWSLHVFFPYVILINRLQLTV